MNEQYPSVLLEKAVGELSKLPGVGRKTALRYALYLLRQDKDFADTFCDSIHRLCHDVRYCEICHNISDTVCCEICSNPQRDASIICVVENVQDVLAIENTQQLVLFRPWMGLDPLTWKWNRWLKGLHLEVYKR